MGVVGSLLRCDVDDAVNSLLDVGHFLQQVVHFGLVELQAQELRRLKTGSKTSNKRSCFYLKPHDIFMKGKLHLYSCICFSCSDLNPYFWIGQILLLQPFIFRQNYICLISEARFKIKKWIKEFNTFFFKNLNQLLCNSEWDQRMNSAGGSESLFKSHKWIRDQKRATLTPDMLWSALYKQQTAALFPRYNT